MAYANLSVSLAQKLAIRQVGLAYIGVAFLFSGIGFIAFDLAQKGGLKKQRHNKAPAVSQLKSMQ